ncbi:hypothetical protein LCGC14_2258850 [marine sediment metagenome]|uniref:Uncharacterized protein n=1 Tax=marine sediment metagenome TaxID=412755 RepID=A0A0F9DMQ6_9ZZZZ
MSLLCFSTCSSAVGVVNVKHDFYDITLIVSVTGEPDTKVKVTYEQCTREKVLENETLAPILEQLEASIDED